MDTNREFAWAAGFIEADGSIGVYRNRSWRQLQLQAAQVYPEPLERLAALWGSNVNGPYKNRNGLIYTWSIRSRKAERAVLDMLPYMGMPKLGKAVDSLILVQDSVRHTAGGPDGAFRYGGGRRVLVPR